MSAKHIKHEIFPCDLIIIKVINLVYIAAFLIFKYFRKEWKKLKQIAT